MCRQPFGLVWWEKIWPSWPRCPMCPRHQVRSCSHNQHCCIISAIKDWIKNMHICLTLYFRHGLECVDSCTAKESESYSMWVFKFKWFLLRTRATSGAGPTLRMLCPTTGRSVGQARETRASQWRGFLAKAVARWRVKRWQRITGGAGTTTKTPPAGITVHLQGRSSF